jgi:tRNA threonylcarbamoyladenosine biosynthesis protein TsaE
MDNKKIGLNLVSNSPQYTKKFGAVLGRLAQEGYIFLLTGDLGSGKTCLTQGIAKGLKIKAKIISPTFVLVREYYGRIPLFHIDLYRLNNIDEIINLGLEQYLDDKGLSVIEWAEKGLTVFPRENLLIKLSYISINKRNLSIESNGSIYRELINKMVKQVEKWN